MRTRVSPVLVNAAKMFVSASFFQVMASKTPFFAGCRYNPTVFLRIVTLSRNPLIIHYQGVLVPLVGLKDGTYSTKVLTFNPLMFKLSN